MFTKSDTKRLWDKLRKKAYRHAYVAEHVRRGVAHQIRALREQRGWTQGKLSRELGKPQSVTSRIEDPNYGKLTIQTLLDIAAALDVALVVKFASFPSFVRQTRDLTTGAMQVPSFEETISDQGKPQLAPSSGSLVQRPIVGEARVSNSESAVLLPSPADSSGSIPVLPASGGESYTSMAIH